MRVAMLAMATAMVAQAAGAQVRPSPVPAPRPVPAAQAPHDATPDPAVDDERRAAAARLLAASRFRERQEVLLSESLRAAQADVVADCINRASAGRSLDDCRATLASDAGARARLAARRSDMLDEVLAASQTIYARRFTAAEMDEISRFFRTAVGQKYGALYPRVIAEVQQRKAGIARRYVIASARGSARPGTQP